MSLQADVETYFDDVLSGRQVAGQYEIKAIERHLADLKTAGDRGYVFDWRHARYTIDWCQCKRRPENVAPVGKWRSEEKRSARMITRSWFFRVAGFPAILSGPAAGDGGVHGHGAVD